MCVCAMVCAQPSTKISLAESERRAQSVGPSVFDLWVSLGAEPPRGGGRAGVLKNRKQKTEGGQGPHYD